MSNVQSLSAKSINIIIGGGAAGIFAAVNCARMNPGCSVVVVEKSSKLLAKVKVSGGGRCNVTNSCTNPKDLIKNYPRGEKWLLPAFREFGPKQTIEWFASRGVILKTEADGRMFPVTDDSQTIIDCLLNEARKYGVKIMMGTTVQSIESIENNFNVVLSGGQIIRCNKILIATGGNPKVETYAWLKKLGNNIELPVPSLFTFNIRNKSVTELMGVTINPVSIRISGSAFQSRGPVLITHWGFSGPAVLKLSAFEARKLNELNYKYSVIINWLPDFSEESLRMYLQEYRNGAGAKFLLSKCPFDLPKRFWEYLLDKSEILPQVKWSELSKKNQNKLINNLICDIYEAEGKTTFKEEFVTCGGVSLDSVIKDTMESKTCKNLYFAGEVLNIDGITGGFNFQAAWTTGWLAAKAMSDSGSIFQ